MTTATDRVTCPACNGMPSRHIEGRDLGCSLCADIGSLPVDAWDRETDPARLVRMLGGVERNRERLQVWSDEMDRLWAIELKHGIPSHPQLYRNTHWWLCDVGGEWATNELKSSLLRCLFANPLIERERVECPTCGGEGVWRTNDDSLEDYDCAACKGEKTIPAPRIDQRWLSCEVRDLVGLITGDCGRVVSTVNAGNVLAVPARPRLDLMPRLRYALMDAGCDDEEMFNHALAGTHVKECWVIAELQAAIEGAK